VQALRLLIGFACYLQRPSDFGRPHAVERLTDTPEAQLVLWTAAHLTRLWRELLLDAKQRTLQAYRDTARARTHGEAVGYAATLNELTEALQKSEATLQRERPALRRAIYETRQRRAGLDLGSGGLSSTAMAQRLLVERARLPPGERELALEFAPMARANVTDFLRGAAEVGSRHGGESQVERLNGRFAEVKAAVRAFWSWLSHEARPRQPTSVEDLTTLRRLRDLKDVDSRGLNPQQRAGLLRAFWRIMAAKGRDDEDAGSDSDSDSDSDGDERSDEGDEPSPRRLAAAAAAMRPRRAGLPPVLGLLGAAL